MSKKAKTVNKTASRTDQVTAPYTSVAPTGLSVSRSGNDFSVSWKVGDQNYSDGQWVLYSFNDGPQQGPVYVHPNTTSYTVTTTATGVRKVAFWVQGKRATYTTSTSAQEQTSKKKKKTTTITTTNVTTVVTYNPATSEWSGIDWYAAVPAAPSLSYSRSTSSSGTFSWSMSPQNSGNEIFTDIELQTCTSRGNQNPPSSGWSASSKSSSGSVSYTETLTSGNVVRWVRVRSRGPAGITGWVYQHHAYGNPATPILDSASASVSGAVTQVTVNFRGAYNLINPIDTIALQYVIAVPTTATLSAPSTGWTDSVSVGGNGGGDKIIANISNVASTDQCMWVRVKASHDGYDTFSGAKLVYKAALATPGVDATPNVSTGKIAVSITENTSCTVAGTVIFYRSQKRPNYDQVMAVLAHGTTSVTIDVPEIKDTSIGYSTVGAYAYVGSTRNLSVNALMKSATAIDTDILARPPAWLDLSAGAVENTVRIKWPWSWDTANSAELAWADHEDAWESTNEPSSYTIEDETVMSWVIADLVAGKRWFFRARLIKDDGSDKLVGPWSAMYSYDLASIPDKPALILNKSVVEAGGSVTARWVFASEDNTQQDYAEICTATISGNTVTYGSVVAHVVNSQQTEIKGNWATGQNYYYCLRVTSTSKKQSEWSDPVTLFVAPPISISVTQNSLDVVGGKYFLTAMPLTVTVTGAGASGQTIVSIVRAEEYHIYRPDGSEADGFKGEHIATHSQNGEAQVTITTDDLLGYLDDGAKYILRCTVIDEYGQAKTVEYPFVVAWSHQAGIPSAEVEIDEWQRIAIIKPIAPANYASGDVCDIYRISSDKPELILEGATFGQTYVDPYPAFGGRSGHRIVTRTANDDYITEDNKLAWFMADIDIGDYLHEDMMIIDVNGDQIELPYNIELQNTWTKDFKRTTYLGGSVQGDWNPAVTRDLSANTVIIRGQDLDTQIAMRKLAGYAGPAHIRTPDGSSMSADIQVRETMEYGDKKVSYSLTVKVVDPEAPDGMTYEEWTARNPVDE